jgi:hypothetical protein
MPIEMGAAIVSGSGREEMAANRHSKGMTQLATALHVPAQKGDQMETGKLIRWLAIGFAICLLGAMPTAVQGRAVALQGASTWQAWYWNNMGLMGSPVLQREEPLLDHDWGVRSPHAAVYPDQFSARWARYIQVQPGTYRFSATSDDGIRVWVDGQLIIDEWRDQPRRTFYADEHLAAGSHLIIVEYYENSGAALVSVSWASLAPPVSNWRGEYFANAALSGSPALVRDDAAISFNWGTGSPGSSVGTDRFSTRWTGYLNLAAGTYRFTITVDDGARLWVNNGLVLDAWRDQAITSYAAEVFVPGGPTAVRMEYYENTGAAVAQLQWAPVGTGPAPGTVIVDDTDAGFVKGGTASGWRSAAEGYGGHLTWTRNNDYVRPNYNWARWYPSLRAARYEVFVYIPDRYTTTSQARYWIAHGEGFTLRVVDQSAAGGRWVSLGTYRFQGTRNDYVSLADVTFEPLLSQLIGFDAIKWEPRSP